MQETVENLHKHYNVILTIFRELQAESEKYPEVDFETAWKFFRDIQKDVMFTHYEPEDSHQEDEQTIQAEGDEEPDPQQEELVSKGKFEIAYIKAKRYDKERSLKGSLCRGEFLDLIVRMLYARYPRNTKYSTDVQPFIRDYFQQTYDTS